MDHPPEHLSTLGSLPGIGGLGPGFEGGAEVHPAVPAADDVAVTTEAPLLPLGKSVLYSSGNFGSGVFYAFNNFILPSFLSGLGAGPVVINLLSSTRSFEGAFVQPVVGAWSDRTWHNRLGRRRYFVALFVPITVLFMILTPFLEPIGKALGLTGTVAILTVVGIGIFLFSLTFNIMYDPYNALLADITPPRQRGAANGLFQAMGAFGQVLLVIIGIVLFNTLGITGLFIVAALALGLFSLPTLFGIRETRELHGVVTRHRYTLRDYWEGLRQDRQIMIYFASQFLLWFGINAITPNLVLYAKKVLHLGDSAALVFPLILLLTSAIFVWPFGVLGDRIGLKRVFLLGMILMAGASIAGIFVRDPTILYFVLGVAGIGNAAQTASSYPLLTRLTFADKMGLYTGLSGTLTSIAVPGSALIAGLIIQQYGYVIMFPFVAVTFLLSLIPLAALNLNKSLVAEAERKAASKTLVVGVAEE